MTSSSEAKAPADGSVWVRVGAAIIDLSNGDVQRSGARLRLTRTELRLLQALVDQRGSPVARQELLFTIWGIGATGLNSRAVDVNVGRLRRKLEVQPSRPRLILTVAGYGYLLQDERRLS